MQISNEFQTLIMILTIYTIVIVCILCSMLINYRYNNQDNTKSNTASNTTLLPSTTTLSPITTTLSPSTTTNYFTQPVAPGINKRRYTNLQRSVLITPNINKNIGLRPSVDSNKGPVQLTLS